MRPDEVKFEDQQVTVPDGNGGTVTGTVAEVAAKLRLSMNTVRQRRCRGCSWAEAMAPVKKKKHWPLKKKAKQHARK